MKIINPKNEKHRRDLEYMCSFMEADSIEYIDHYWWEEYLIKKGPKTLSLHACSNKPDGGFLTTGQNRWTMERCAGAVSQDLSLAPSTKTEN